MKKKAKKAKKIPLQEFSVTIVSTTTTTLHRTVKDVDVNHAWDQANHKFSIAYKSDGMGTEHGVDVVDVVSVDPV